MKRLLAVALAAFALTSFGAWEKIGSLRLADVDSLVKGVSRLGEFTGNQMLGIMASQAVGALQPVTFFGPGRPGAAMSFELFLDGDKLSGDPKEALEALECAILYPIAQTKAEFIAAHPGATEKDGLVLVPAADDDDDDDDDDEDSCCGGCDDDTYVAFSEDGKWAAYSDKPEQAKSALAGAKLAEKKMDGDLVKVFVTPKGWTAVVRAAEALEKESEDKDRKQLQDVLAILKQITAVAGGLRVNERGLDVRGVVNVVKGSDLAKVGLKTFTTDAWKMAGADALYVQECAEDSGTKAVSWDSIRTLLKKHGIDTPFLSVAEPAPNYGIFTVDVPVAIEYFKGISNVVSKIDGKKFVEDFMAVTKDGDTQIPLKNPAIGAALAIRGFTPAVDPGVRYATTLPEAKDKPVYRRCVISYYSLFKALVPVILENVGADLRPMLEPMLTTLPPEGKSGIAYAVWREKDSHRFIARIGADEFKGVSACFAAFTAIQMQKTMKQTNVKAKAKTKAKAKDEPAKK